MGFADGLDDGEPAFRAPLPPDDRLWRHPSEIGRFLPDRAGGGGRREPRGWALALASGMVGALLATGLTAVAGRLGASHTTTVERVVERRAAPDTASASGTPRGNGVAAIAERVRPAIVELMVAVNGGQTTGSGVVFRSDGHILTNEHVTHGASNLTVILSDGRKLKGHVVGGDVDTDVAVVEIDGGPYPTATLGTATLLKAGEECIAIGSPLGLAGGPSVSVGVVSATGRTLTAEGGSRLYDMIQTDASISPGSSGGALLDGTGAVIGVTTAIAVSEGGGSGLGFATPVDIARSVADQLITSGKATHVWVGVEGSDVDEAQADRLGIPGGATIKRVLDGGPAARAGLRAGDVVVAIDGQQVRTMAALVVALRARHPGDVVGLDIIRDGRRTTVHVTLRERPS